jgi:hypothetical protein
MVVVGVPLPLIHTDTGELAGELVLYDEFDDPL